jgi:hypothetical protein
VLLLDAHEVDVSNIGHEKVPLCGPNSGGNLATN